MSAAAKKGFAAALVAILVLLALASGASGRPAKRDAFDRDRQPPSMPENLRVEAATARSVTVAWDPSTDNRQVKGYYVYVNGRRSTVSSTEYTAGRLDCGESVAVWVVAFDRSGNRSQRAETIASTAACPDTQAPFPPTGVRQAATAQDAVVLAWDPALDNVGVVSYGVYRSGLPVAWTPEPTVTLSQLTCSSTYEYAIDAVDAAGNQSSRTPYWVVTAPCADVEPPSTPSDVTLTDSTASSLSLEWSPSSDNVAVVGYRLSLNGVPQSTVSSGDQQVTSYPLMGEIVITVEQPKATLSGLACGMSYDVGVTAYDSAGNDSLPAGLSAETDECETEPIPPPILNDTTPPSVPTGLAVLGATTTSITLGWNASTDDVGVDGYGVYVNGSGVQPVAQPGTTVTGLDCGTTYTFGVDAYDAAENHSARATVAAATAACAPPADTQPPAKPVLSLGERTQTSLVLQWQPGTDNVGVDHYNVFRGTSSGVGSQVQVAETTALSYTFTGLTCGTDYSLALEVEDATGNKSLLAEAIMFPVRTLDCAPPPDSTAPSQPGNLAVSGATATSVSLSWSAATDNVGVTGYGVYRNGTLVTTVSQWSATVSGLTCGTASTFEVDAVDLAGNRSTRAGVTASTVACPDTQAPTIPANVTTTSRTTTSIALSWSFSTDNVGVTGYGLYLGGQLVGTVTGTTGIFSDLACGTNYTFAVDAYDGAGNRSAKATVMVATTACPSPTPTITMGEPSVMSTNDSGNGNLLVTQKATLAQNGTLRRMSFYVTTASGNLRMAVYAANGSNGGPGTRLAETSSFTPTTGWNSVDVLAPVTLGAGNYWLAYLPSSSTLAFRVGSGGEARWTNYSYGPAPATFPATTLGDTVRWSLYATLDVTNEVPPPPPPPPSLPTPQCADGADNDGDGAVDMTDPGCTDAADNDETNASPSPAPPPSGGYPDASNTGPTGLLTESTGNVTVSTSGAVIENRRINGCVTVNAANVTIRNSEIRCDGSSVVWSGSTGLVVEDTLIECGHRPGTTALTWRNYTVRRSELFGCENILWAESNVVIEDSYIHDPIPCCTWPEPLPHTDSVQIPNGASNIRIEHNRIYGKYIGPGNFGNSAVTGAAGLSMSVTNVVLNNNLLAGGGYTIDCPGIDGGYTWTNNRFSRVFVDTVGGWGPIYYTCWQHTNSGNVYHETGQPVG